MGLFDQDLPPLAMSPAERSRSTVLIVESDGNERNNMRTCLRSLGYGGIADAPNHASAIERLQDRPVTHIIFEAKRTNMPAKDFLQKVMDVDKRITCIPSSFEPNVDDVFDLMVMGARGYLVKPFTIDTVELAIVNATKGEPLSDVVLQAKDRNEALVAIMMGSLDKTAMILRQALKFETARRELPRAMTSMRNSAELAKTFCKDGEEGLLLAMEKFCIDRSKGPATRLGRLRKKLQTSRTKEEEEEERKKNAPQGGARF